jgi:hypothetical protein
MSIEVLTSNFSAIAGVNKGLFPDRYVEGGILFKRGSTYYMSEGSCCCFCRGGSGVVVYQSQSLNGPWVRQPLDLNCDRTDGGDICGSYGDRPHDPIRIDAQGIGLSLIPLADGSTAYLWHGERWLSALNNNPRYSQFPRISNRSFSRGRGPVMGKGTLAPLPTSHIPNPNPLL